MKISKKILLQEEWEAIGEGLESDIKKYIKKNKKELNSLATMMSGKHFINSYILSSM